MEIAYKNKKDLLQELDLYQEMILRKMDELDLISAMKKVKSAITLIQENQQYFNLDQELSKFMKLHQNVIKEKLYHRDRIIRKYDNLLNEDLTEDNLNNFCKLLAMLKEQVDEGSDKFGLDEIQNRINDYFHCIKKMYILISSYKILEFQKASSEILKFVQEIKSGEFKNLKGLTLTLYRNLITDQLNKISKSRDYITITELSHELNIQPKDLVKLISLINEDINNPIRKFDSMTELILFK